MTKDEMIKKFGPTSDTNYEKIQDFIKQEIIDGSHQVRFCTDSNIMKGVPFCTARTVDKLRKDGFSVESKDGNYWTVSW